jgi:hypothetical protein
MLKRLVIFFLISEMLLSSIILPLGDLSLLKDLPAMYHAYEKVVSPDDKSICDFIGDYLLDGKDLLGHNKHDRPEKQGAMQFQHPAAFAMLIHVPCTTVNQHNITETSRSFTIHLPGTPSDYHPSLLRPPLPQA